MKFEFESTSFYHFTLYLEFKEDSISEYIKVNNSSEFTIFNAKAVYKNPLLRDFMFHSKCNFESYQWGTPDLNYQECF